MDCQRTHELLSSLIDGELPFDLSRSVLAHLGSCADCRAHADELRSLGGLVRALGARAPVGLGARILTEARAAQAAPRRSLRNVGPAGARAAAVLLGAASVALLLSPLTKESSRSPVAPRSGFQLLVSESQADLELVGSFSGDLQALLSRPEGRLIRELTGGR